MLKYSSPPLDSHPTRPLPPFSPCLVFSPPRPSGFSARPLSTSSSERFFPPPPPTARRCGGAAPRFPCAAGPRVSLRPASPAARFLGARVVRRACSDCSRRPARAPARRAAASAPDAVRPVADPGTGTAHRPLPAAGQPLRVPAFKATISRSQRRSDPSSRLRRSSSGLAFYQLRSFRLLVRSDCGAAQRSDPGFWMNAADSLQGTRIILVLNRAGEHLLMCLLSRQNQDATAGSMTMEMRLQNSGCTMGRTRTSSAKKEGIRMTGSILLRQPFRPCWRRQLDGKQCLVNPTSAGANLTSACGTPSIQVLSSSTIFLRNFHDHRVFGRPWSYQDGNTSPFTEANQ
ncbi:uncharacterized protein LOC120700641 [Panicum virgatum]|uniref:uncharacterized protein LOC120700641 n=1 Tax=Panicum virgatum TaxID=38727 RepID=UPI0019D6383F|nr:uncharacterized protein LOC120700641 [Panicum virgatum]